MRPGSYDPRRAATPTTVTDTLTETVAVTQPFVADAQAALLEEALAARSERLAMTALAGMGRFSINQPVGSSGRRPLELVIAHAPRHALAPLVKKAIERGAQLQGRDCDGRSLCEQVLRRSAPWDNLLATLAVLVASGADINATSARGASVVERALRQHQPDGIQLGRLLALGVDVTACNHHGLSPLVLSVLHGGEHSAAQLETLLSALRGPDASAERRTAASTQSQIDLALFVVWRFVPSAEQTPLRERLMQAGAQPAAAIAQGATPVAALVERQFAPAQPLPTLAQIQQHLVTQPQGAVRSLRTPQALPAPPAALVSVPVPIRPLPPLPQVPSAAAAPTTGRRAMPPSRPMSEPPHNGLLRRGRRTLSLWSCIEQGDGDNVATMLGQSAALALAPEPRTGALPLGIAARHGHRALLASLCRSIAQFNPEAWPAALNMRDRQQMTPLHWAVQQGKEHVVRFLLSQGVDLQPTPPADAFPSRHRWLAPGQISALTLAAFCKHAFVARQLIEADQARDSSCFDVAEAYLLSLATFGPADAVTIGLQKWTRAARA